MAHKHIQTCVTLKGAHILIHAGTRSIHVHVRDPVDITDALAIVMVLGWLFGLSVCYHFSSNMVCFNARAIYNALLHAVCCSLCLSILRVTSGLLLVLTLALTIYKEARQKKNRQ